MPSQTVYKVTVKVQAWGLQPPGTTGPSIVSQEVFDNIGKIEIVSQARPSLLILKDKEGHIRLIRTVDSNVIIEAESREEQVILRPDELLAPTNGLIQ